MAATITGLRVPSNVLDRYDQLAKSTHRTRSFYMNQALEAQIDELEHEYGLMADIEAYKRGELETSPLDDVVKRLGLEENK